MKGLASLQFSLRYDPLVLSVNGVRAGDFLGDALLQTGQEAGLVKFALAVPTREGLVGRGVVAQVEFAAAGVSRGNSTLVLGDLRATNNQGRPLSLHLRDGGVVVEAKLRGDYDGDGTLTANDARAALQMSVGELPENLNLDMNDDGRVTADDARRILNHVYGIAEPEERG